MTTVPNVAGLGELRHLLTDAIISCVILAVLVMFIVQVLKLPLRSAFYRHFLEKWWGDRNSSDAELPKLRESLKNEKLEPTRLWQLLSKTKVDPPTTPGTAASADKNVPADKSISQGDSAPSTNAQATVDPQATPVATVDSQSKSLATVASQSSPLRFYQEAARACFLPRALFMKKLENLAREVIERPSEREAEFLRLSHGSSAFDQLLVIETDRLGRTHPVRLSELREQRENGGSAGEDATPAGLRN